MSVLNVLILRVRR